MDTAAGKIFIQTMQESECVVCNCVGKNNLRISLRSQAILQAKQRNQVRTIMRKGDRGEDRAFSILSDKAKGPQRQRSRSTSK